MSAVLNTETPSTAVAVAAPLSPSESAWKLANRQAQALASSTLVPEMYRGNVANCLIALEMANRMGASPLLTMQNLYVVHGNPSWSAKFLIATFNQNGKFSALRYEWNDAHTECRAYAIEKSTGERLDGPLVSIEMAKAEGWSTKNGSKWKSMPELMLMYRAATFFVRTYAPELSMGLHTVDEVEDFAEAPRSTGLGAVRAALDGTVDEPSGATVEARGYGEFADDIQAAADRDMGESILAVAKVHLAPELYDELVSVFQRRWD